MIGFVVASCISFFANRIWTFDSSVKTFPGLIRSLFVALVVLAIILIAMYLFVEIL